MPELRRRINFKPLLRKAGLNSLPLGEKRRRLRKIEKEVKRQVRHEMNKENWIRRPSARFRAHIRVETGPNSVTVIMTGPAFYQIKGVQTHQMRYLKGRTIYFKPKGSTRYIFRTVTEKSLLAGHWTHPGRPGRRFVDKALDKTREIMADEIARAAVDGLVAYFRD